VTSVVSDTSPINYLCLIEAIEVLPALFSEVLIPPSVLNELRHPRVPKAVADWLNALPPWIRQQAPMALRPGLKLDAGETEAISLALELNLHAVLIDEADGRQAAEDCGLKAVGTLSILITAEAHGLLDLETALTRLRATNFHVDAATIDSLIAQARARKGSS
jgi:predicted nucleic acid-binding protein